MRRSRLGGALLMATGAFALTFAGGIVAMDMWAGRSPRMAMAIEITAVVTVIVIVSGLLVQWPILRAMRSLKPAIVASAGALLAVVPVGLFVRLFSDGDDPATLLGYIRFWLHVPGEFLFGFAPMAIAGAVLGWFASDASGRSVHS